ncbi:cation transport regulator ChaB, partial [Enterococcus hirae]
MPCRKLADLPGSLREHLPRHAQEIYRAAFNNAREQYREPAKWRAGATREAVAHRVAWAAVKQQYTQR